jgi:hypothetical protein
MKNMKIEEDITSSNNGSLFAAAVLLSEKIYEN